MSDNSSENKQWSNPKDYGLPYVEVTPINPEDNKEPIFEKKPIEETVIVSLEESSFEKEKEAEPIQEAKIEKTSVEDKKKESEAVKEKLEERQASTATSKYIDSGVRTGKKNNSWVAIVLVLAVLIISVIVWQLTSKGDEYQSSEYNLTEQETSQNDVVSGLPTVENTQAEEIQTIENQDSILNSNSSLEEHVETPQTGTTIDRTSAEILIRIESKAERPIYFIVVGSLPNEKMAISESKQYIDRASSIYLILPYEDVKNYRLAIGSFSSFRKANEELETIKDQYTEALWILKY